MCVVMSGLVGHGWALFEQHPRRPRQATEVEAHDGQRLEVSVGASSRDVVTPLADGRTNPAGPRASDDNPDSELRSEAVRRGIVCCIANHDVRTRQA